MPTKRDSETESQPTSPQSGLPNDDPLLKLTKAELIAELDPEMSISGTIRYYHHSKRALVALIHSAAARRANAAKQPCPKGHLPGDPACDFIACYLTTIDPLPTWITDELKPVPSDLEVFAKPAVTATEFVEQENLRGLLELMQKTDACKYINLEKFAELYNQLDRQFTPLPQPSKWYRRWWLKFTVWWKENLVMSTAKERGYKIMDRDWYLFGYLIILLALTLGITLPVLVGRFGLLWSAVAAIGILSVADDLRKEGWWR